MTRCVSALPKIDPVLLSKSEPDEKHDLKLDFLARAKWVTFGNSTCAIPSWLQVSLFRTARSSQGRAVGAAERTLDGEDWSERIKQPGNWTRVGVLGLGQIT